MKRLFKILPVLTFVTLATGAWPSIDDIGSAATGHKIGAATDLVKAATVSDKEVIGYASQYAKYSDKTNNVPAAESPYAQRLAKLTDGLRNEDGLKLNYKVYMDKEINAFSLADGTIRVNSGLMDLMNDNEVLSVIGHEIGHVKHGHSTARFRAAYLASAARKGVASAGGTAGFIAESQLGGLGEELTKAQFSQANEKESDDYSLKFMKKHGYDTKASVSSLEKLAALGGESSIFSTHPDSKARAARIKAQLK